jgi:pimeloyl-ACP methyl ester carboxylesterase
MEMDANLPIERASPQVAEEKAEEQSPTGTPRRGARQLLQDLAILCFLAAPLALLALLAGASYNWIKAHYDAQRFPQEGRSVDIGGYRLNINCRGQGSPTVVLEAGLGVPAISWRAVQSEIAKFTRVCSYDRAGYDWSDPGPMPRTTARSVRELHTLLKNAGERPPFILVGHSFGGTNVRVYNGAYPREVAGLVLADTGNEEMKSPASFQRLIDSKLRGRQLDGKWATLLYWTGISRLAAGIQIDDPALPYDKQEWSYFLIQPKVLRAVASEMENLDEGKAELKAAGTLGDKPLIVLIARQHPQDLDLPTQDAVAVSQLWVEDEKLLAQLSTRGKWIIVENSTHMTPLERPDAIVSAVRELYSETR